MPIAPIDQKNGEPRAMKFPRKKGVKNEADPVRLPAGRHNAGRWHNRCGTGREFRTGLPVTSESLPDDVGLLRQQTWIPQNPSDLSGLMTGK